MAKKPQKSQSSKSKLGTRVRTLEETLDKFTVAYINHLNETNSSLHSLGKRIAELEAQVNAD